MIEIGNSASNLGKFLNQNKFKGHQYETKATPDRQQTAAQFCCLRLRQRYKALNKMPFRQHSLLCRSSSSSSSSSSATTDYSSQFSSSDEEQSSSTYGSLQSKKKRRVQNVLKSEEWAIKLIIMAEVDDK
uniref:Uncharacterized protein n=1 Tax=Globodera rostochiensis TaxID=31243 RepID=A0A914H5K6_GLORO